MNSAKRIVLIDSTGAFVTALLLFLFSGFDRLVGMPKEILHILSFVAGVYGVYSMSCYLFIKGSLKLFLIGLVIANILYCIITFTLVQYYYPQLSWWAVTYFICEIVIIGTLVLFELKAATRI